MKHVPPGNRDGRREASGADQARGDSDAAPLPRPVTSPVVPSLHLERLSGAERRVFDLALDGRSIQAIAGELVLSTATVRSHLTHIYSKLDVQGRLEMLARASTFAGRSDRKVNLTEPAATSTYRVALWFSAAGSAIGIAAGLVVPVSAIVVGPTLLTIALLLGRSLPGGRRWVRLPLMGAGVILSGEALMIAALLRPI